MFIKLLSQKQCNLLNFSNQILNRILKRSLCLETDFVKNKYKYLLILDFEATCDTKKIKSQEIIEFPCLKINLNNLLEEGRFHQYVKPVHNPVLSNFCVDLTGILQETVDESKTFPEIYTMFEEWREQENLTVENSVYLTSGDWDLGHMLPHQCALCQLEIPAHANVWIDIKKLFGYSHNVFHNNFSDIMKHYNLEFKGRQHSGIDDCLNILQVVRKMAMEGVEFKPTTKLYDSKPQTLSVNFSPKKIQKLKPSSVFKKKQKLQDENQYDILYKSTTSNNSN